MGMFEIFVSATYFVGFFMAIHALWNSRTPQGSVAWVLALLLMPIFTIPLFLIFGKSRFYGKIAIKNVKDKNALSVIDEISKFSNNDLKTTDRLFPIDNISKKIGHPGFTNGNHAEVLINGEETYHEMINIIRGAKEYILFQFYIFKSDHVGERFLEELKIKAREGIRIYFISDKIGTNLKNSIRKQLEAENIDVQIFYSSKNWESRFQLNFRNHKKLVIVDGKTCITGGLNIGEDYIGKDPKMGFWRDTAIKIQGPSVQVAQLSFLTDWYWATNKILPLNWRIECFQEDSELLINHTGPSDQLDVAHLTHLQLINLSKNRLWVASPYFIPTETILSALFAAKLRGVDVRVILPSFSDNPMLEYATTVYVEKLINFNIPVYFYEKGFMHQKVMISDELSSIGSLNMDSRSFFLNFEIFTISNEKSLNDKVTSMLIQDMKDSRLVDINEMRQAPWYRKLAARFFNLFAPIL